MLFAAIKVAITLPPILVEFQNIIDVKFLQRTIEYCLATNEEHVTFPILSVANELILKQPSSFGQRTTLQTTT